MKDQEHDYEIWEACHNLKDPAGSKLFYNIYYLSLLYMEYISLCWAKFSLT